VLGDFNRDGKLDVALLAFNLKLGAVVNLLLGNGDGTFQSPESYLAGYNPSGLAVGDFNNDRAMDLAVMDGSVNILLNTGRRSRHFPNP